MKALLISTQKINRKISYLKSILLILLFSSFLLSACSSGSSDSDDGGSEKYADPSATVYQQGLNAYQSNDYSGAITYFQTLITQYADSIYVDNSQYYIARCYHKLGQFDDARGQYDVVINGYPNSNWVDNAKYYKAVADMDEADNQSDPLAAYELLDSAIVKLNNFIDDPNHVSSSVLDGANYFKGRSYYKQAELVSADANLSTNNFDWFYIQAKDIFLGITTLVPTSPTWHDDALYYLARSYQALSNQADAINTYGLLLTDPINIDSNWVDNARYQLGKINYNEAVAATDALTKMQAYSAAITEFDMFIAALDANSVAYQQSSRKDNMYYFKGRSLDEQAQIILANAASQNPDPLITGDVVQLQIDARAAYQSVLDTDAQSVYADNAAYRLGRSYYDYGQTLIDPVAQLGIYIAAANALQGFLQGGLYESSVYVYRGRYFLGRSRQEQGELQLVDPAVSLADAQSTLDLAHVAYQQTIDADPVGIYSDNAQYQIGAIYYDVAAQSVALAQQTAVQENYAVAQNDFSAAINAFDMVLNNSNYQNSNYADNAQYFKARSYHQVADIPVQYRIAVNNGIDFTVTGYVDVQAEYELFIADYSQSNWIDNAYFERANTYYSQAQDLLDTAAIVATYNGALDDYFWVVSNSQNIAENLKLDDESLFQMGMIYHATNYCVDEQTVLNGFVALPYAETTSLSAADQHLNDLVNALQLPAGTVDHSCDNGAFPGLHTYTLP